MICVSEQTEEEISASIMKAVVFACLGILLMTVDLGSGHGDLRGSDDELLDNVEHIRSVDDSEMQRNKWTYKTIGDGSTFRWSCAEGQEVFFITATYGRVECYKMIDEVVEKKCQWKQACEFPVNYLSLETDPCRGIYKWFSAGYACVTKGAHKVYRLAHGYENYKTTLNCGSQQIRVVFAVYISGTCGYPVSRRVKKECDGKTNCEFTPGLSFFKFDPCPFHPKTVHVIYRCG